MKRIIALSILAVLLFSFCACEASNEKTFVQDEFSITLTEDYGLVPHISYFVSYETADKKAVLVSKNSKEIVEDVANKTNLSLMEYANLVIETNQKGENLAEQDGLVYYTYTDTVGYTYFATVHESNEAFWLVQFVCESTKYNDMKEQFLTFAQSVVINET